MVQFAIPSQPAQAPPQYAFAQASPPPPRQYAAQGTSSAFSSSANPDEDWTKISDLAERRRIQNRIAQRNYRKKLKRRLEDLERRAGSPEDAEAQKPAVSPPTAKMARKVTKPRQAQQDRPQQQQVQQQQQQQQQQARETNNMVKPMSQMQFTPPMEHSDEFIFGTYDDRERSNTPPMFNYSSYPAPDEMMMPPYGTSQSYPTGGMVTTTDTYPSYLTAPVHSTLPSMSHFADASMKRDYSTDAYFSYGFMPGMDMHAAYDHTNPQTPPLTHSFDHSANCSEAGYEYPTTPLSMPGSPGLIQHQSN